LAPYFVTTPPPDPVGAFGSSKTAIGQTAFALGSALSTAILLVSFGAKLHEALEQANVLPEQQGIISGVIAQYADTGRADGAPADVTAIVSAASEIYVAACRNVHLALLELRLVLALATVVLLRHGSPGQTKRDARG